MWRSRGSRSPDDLVDDVLAVAPPKPRIAGPLPRMDAHLRRRRCEAVQEMVDEAAEVVGVGVEAWLEPLVALAAKSERPRRQVEHDDELLAGALVHALHRRPPVGQMLEEVTAQHRVVGAGQPAELVERALPEPLGLGREPLAR